MLALSFLLVVVVVILKVAELAPAGTVTFAGTIALVGLLLVREITTTVFGFSVLGMTMSVISNPSEYSG